MMLFTMKELQDLFPGNDHLREKSVIIEKINTDSRVKIENSLFIPIVGENFNGHDFAEQAIENGAVALLWDEKEELPPSIPENFPVCFTKDTTEGLQTLAAYYRKTIDPTVVGITGSNGKTTTKDLVSSIVKTTYRTHATKGNLNNEIGLPITILDMPRDTEVLVLELGMNGFGEIELLSNIAKPDYAIITNIGESHIEFLGSREGIAKAKQEIISGMEEEAALIVDGDEPLLNRLQTEKNLQLFRCGFSEENDMQITATEVSIDGTTFTIQTGEQFRMPLYGRHHAKNAAYALKIAELLEIPLEKQQEGLQTLTHTSMRFELEQALHGAVVVNDSYNASPTSMKAAIDVIKQLDGFTERILVLGDILELGDYAVDMHRSIADVIDRPITHLYTYGDKAKLITEEVERENKKVRCKHFATKEQLVKELEKELEDGVLVLFKASRGLEFETMVDEIVKKREEQ